MRKIVYCTLLAVGFVLPSAGNQVFAVPPNYSWHADDKTTGWTLNDREKSADVLQFNTGTTSSSLNAIIAEGIPGKVYIVFNNSVGTVTLKCENGTGTDVTTSKSYLVFTNDTPDIVKITSN